ncbi:unnamed protein product [Alopecurus aequalis]
MIRRGRIGTSPAAADASLPDDDDMLREILLRLPPQPSSLPRAAAVCKRWLGLVTDPTFHRQFCAHHGKPPLLGFFVRGHEGLVFTPVLDAPNCIPPQRFSLRCCSGSWEYTVLNIRHGLVLVHDCLRKEVVVCNPITSEQRCIAIPPELIRRAVLKGAVFCAASDLGHVHGGCHASPFNVVLVSTARNDSRYLARVYSSQTGIWGDLILKEASSEFFEKHAVLVGNCLYWLSTGDDILEFDLDEHSLSVIKAPPVYIGSGDRLIVRAEDGSVGFAALSYPRIHMLRRNVNCHGVATWLLWKTIEMHSIPGLPPPVEGKIACLLGYDEDIDVIFLHTSGNVYGIQLQLMESKKLYQSRYISTYCQPFKSFYTPGTTTVDEFNGAEMLHDA